MFKIEKNIPIVDSGKKTKYPFKEMDIGDSFFIEDNRRVVSASSYYGIRNNKRFSVLKVEGGYRVWRTK